MWLSSSGIWPKACVEGQVVNSEKVGQPMLVQVIVPDRNRLPIKHRERLTSGVVRLPVIMSIMTSPVNSASLKLKFPVFLSISQRGIVEKDPPKNRLHLPP